MPNTAPAIVDFQEQRDKRASSTLRPWNNGEWCNTIIRTSGHAVASFYGSFGELFKEASKGILTRAIKMTDICGGCYVSKPTAIKYLRTLERGGFITVEMNASPHIYTVVRPEEWQEQPQRFRVEKDKAVYYGSKQPYPVEVNSFILSEETAFTTRSNYQTINQDVPQKDVSLISNEISGDASDAATVLTEEETTPITPLVADVPPLAKDNGRGWAANPLPAPPAKKQTSKPKAISLAEHFAKAKGESPQAYEQAVMTALRFGVKGHNRTAILGHVALDLLGSQNVPDMKQAYARLGKTAQYLDSAAAVAGGIFIASRKPKGISDETYAYIQGCAKGWLRDRNDSRAKDDEPAIKPVPDPNCSHCQKTPGMYKPGVPVGHKDFGLFIPCICLTVSVLA